jgi:hypothetical protein
MASKFNRDSSSLGSHQWGKTFSGADRTRRLEQMAKDEVTITAGVARLTQVQNDKAFNDFKGAGAGAKARPGAIENNMLQGGPAVAEIQESGTKLAPNTFSANMKSLKDVWVQPEGKPGPANPTGLKPGSFAEGSITNLWRKDGGLNFGGKEAGGTGAPGAPVAPGAPGAAGAPGALGIGEAPPTNSLQSTVDPFASTRESLDSADSMGLLPPGTDLNKAVSMYPKLKVGYPQLTFLGKDPLKQKESGGRPLWLPQ